MPLPCILRRRKSKETDMHKLLFATSIYPMRRISLLLIIGLVLMGTVAYGQGTASIVGTVTDASGAAVPNAKILITNTETGLLRTTVTNTTGSYAARELAIGHYNVRVEAPGFKASER